MLFINPWILSTHINDCDKKKKKMAQSVECVCQQNIFVILLW